MSLANVMSSTIQHDDEEMHTDARVNLDLLSQTPLAALLPLLQLLRQWGQVRLCLFQANSRRCSICIMKYVLQASEDNVIVEQLSGAMTNLVYKCSMDTNGKVCEGWKVTCTAVSWCAAQNQAPSSCHCKSHLTLSNQCGCRLLGLRLIPHWLFQLRMPQGT